MITITHEHAQIFLKQPTFAELDQVLANWSDEELLETFEKTGPLSEAEKREWYRRMVQPSDERNFYCLIFTTENQLVGEISFHNYDPGTRVAYLQVMARNEYRSHGYGKEAIPLLMDYYFNIFGGNEMRLRVKLENSDAIEFLTQCGFEKIPLNEDTLTFGLTMERFNTIFN